MFLKSITIKGFKSFADTTQLEFESGITVVVGPNGSGKSNVVDAIAWVLGAQAPSAVRSHKMDDVIFAGTEKRSALGRAEVSLTIDNSSNLLPIDFTEVTITRTLFRTGESEYSINGATCRLLDIQELLSDSGVGRQQHIIVSQGQIDTILNSRPEERRLIIEEAAGILKYRRRKEKAERRLAATEANTMRLNDLLEEAKRQLRPLKRQADDAKRHGEVVKELQSIKQFLAGRDLRMLRERLVRESVKLTDLKRIEQENQSTVTALQTRINSIETKLTELRGSKLNDVLANFEALNERCRGLNAVLAERHRNIHHQLKGGPSRDMGPDFASELEAAQNDLSGVLLDLRSLETLFEALEIEEKSYRRERQLFDRAEPSRNEATDIRAAQVKGQLESLSESLQRDKIFLQRLLEQKVTIEKRLEHSVSNTDNARYELMAANETLREHQAMLHLVERKRNDATTTYESSEAALREAEQRYNHWSARKEALELALNQARSRAGTSRFASVNGVLGTLLDVVEVDAGWERAFEASLGEVMRAVVMANEGAAQKAIDLLVSSGEAGAVLALGILSDVSFEAREMLDKTILRSCAASEIEVAPLRRYVRSNLPEVNTLLDRLLWNVVVIDSDWTRAVSVVLRAPEALVVTKNGDRFGLSGWRVGGAVSATGTKAALKEAEEVLGEAASIHEHARQNHSNNLSALEAIKTKESSVIERLKELEQAVVSAELTLKEALMQKKDFEGQLTLLEERINEGETQEIATAKKHSELKAILPKLLADEKKRLEKIRKRALKRFTFDSTAKNLTDRRQTLQVRKAELERHKIILTERIDELQSRYKEYEQTQVTARNQQRHLRRRLQVEASLIDLVKSSSELIQQQLLELRAKRTQQQSVTNELTNELGMVRSKRAEVEEKLRPAQRRLARAETAKAETLIRIENLVEKIESSLGLEPEAVLNEQAPELPSGVTHEERRRDLERDLRLMGPINPLALEEYIAQRERYDFLASQLEDVKVTRRDLAKLIRSINTEIEEIFLAAYEDVAANFGELFETLFPGGRGSLKLTEPSDLLATGIEVGARPSGKNIAKLSLLSGGERSLTALAFLFAVFRSRPSPFYVMDEVEAALDDVNLFRFVDLIRQFRTEAQLVIVSHQKRTMEAADCLYGVSMQPGGSSKVVSQKVQ